MNQLLASLKKIAPLLAVILLLAAAGFYLLTFAGSFEDSFIGVVANLIRIPIFAALIAGVAVLLLMKKEELAAKALIPVFSWWAIDTILSGMSQAAAIGSGYPGLYVTESIFCLLASLTLLGALVMFILSYIGKAPLYHLFWLLLAALQGVMFIDMVLRFACVGTYDFGWTSTVQALGNMALSAGMLAAAFALWYKPVETDEPEVPVVEGTAELEAPDDKPTEEPEKAE